MNQIHTINAQADGGFVKGPICGQRFETVIGDQPIAFLLQQDEDGEPIFLTHWDSGATVGPLWLGRLLFKANCSAQDAANALIKHLTDQHGEVEVLHRINGAKKINPPLEDSANATKS